MLPLITPAAPRPVTPVPTHAGAPTAPVPVGTSFATLVAPLLQVARPGGLVQTQGGGTAASVPPTAAEVASRDGQLQSLGTPGRWAQRLPGTGRPWAAEIDRAARENNIDPSLLAAVVWQESAFDPDARSAAGAIGLGQLMPGTAADLGVDPHDPAANLDGAARYLRTQIDRFGSVELGLAAYNAGPGAVEKHDGIPPFDETRRYVPAVLERRARLLGLETS